MLNEEFEEEVQHYLNAIGDYHPVDSSFKYQGGNLYNLLLKEPLTAFSENPKKLIIIPEGILNHLPFEALPVPEPDEDIRWLVQDYTCSYAYSATLLQEQLKNTP